MSGKNNEQINPPPEFEELLVELAWEVNGLSTIVRVLSEGILNDESPNLIGLKLQQWWDLNKCIHDDQKKLAITSALEKELQLGIQEGENFDYREFLNKLILNIYSDIIHCFPRIICFRCKEEIEENADTSHYCGSCDNVFCFDCFDKHSCIIE